MSWQLCVNHVLFCRLIVQAVQALSHVAPEAPSKTHRNAGESCYADANTDAN
jgi:hypothetical protein